MRRNFSVALDVDQTLHWTWRLIYGLVKGDRDLLFPGQRWQNPLEQRDRTPLKAARWASVCVVRSGRRSGMWTRPWISRKSSQDQQTAHALVGHRVDEHAACPVMDWALGTVKGCV